MPPYISVIYFNLFVLRGKQYAAALTGLMSDMFRCDLLNHYNFWMSFIYSLIQHFLEISLIIMPFSVFSLDTESVCASKSHKSYANTRPTNEQWDDWESIAYPIMPIIINIMRMYTAVPFHKKIVRARHWICHTVSAIALCVYLWNEFTSIWTKSMQIMRLIFIDCVRLMPRSDEKYNEVQRM